MTEGAGKMEEARMHDPETAALTFGKIYSRLLEVIEQDQVRRRSDDATAPAAACAGQEPGCGTGKSDAGTRGKEAAGESGMAGDGRPGAGTEGDSSKTEACSSGSASHTTPSSSGTRYSSSLSLPISCTPSPPDLMFPDLLLRASPVT